jgi:hypothetical protein
MTILNIHFHAKTQRKTSNLSITSCKSSNPVNPDSDKIKLDITKKLCYYRTICPTLTFRKKIDRRDAIEEGKRERTEKGKRARV